jgi:hypothetical protein
MCTASAPLWSQVTAPVCRGKMLLGTYLARLCEKTGGRCQRWIDARRERAGQSKTNLSAAIRLYALGSEPRASAYQSAPLRGGGTPPPKPRSGFQRMKPADVPDTIRVVRLMG